LALTDLLAYKKIYDATTGLIDLATAIDTKYSNSPYNCSAITTRTNSIKSFLGATNIWGSISSLADDNMRENGLFQTGNICKLFVPQLTDTEAAMAKLLEGTADIVGVGAADKYLDHIDNHLTYILNNFISCSDTRTKLDHVISDLTGLNTNLNLFESAFDELENLLRRIDKALAIFTNTFGCAVAIMDQFVGNDMIDLFNKLGIGATQEDKEASLVNKALQSVQDNLGEPNFVARLNAMTTDLKTGDNWETDMTSIKDDATNSHSAIINLSTPFP
jgi:hypothetical protein